jgi:hypothetical protein
MPFIVEKYVTTSGGSRGADRSLKACEIFLSRACLQNYAAFAPGVDHILNGTHRGILMMLLDAVNG